jgi:hypothetical protein
MIRKTILFIVSIALVAGLGGAGCSSAQPPVPLTEPVPQRANLVASIQINEILTDEDLIEAYDQAEKDADMPQTFEEAMQEFEDETGIDPRDFDEAVVFSDTECEDGYWGATITGTVDEEELIENIEQETGEELTFSNYLGYKRYADESGEIGLCFLSDDAFLIGTLDAVEDALDVLAGDAMPLAGPVVDTYEALGDVWLRVAAELPAEAMEEIAGDESSIESETLERVEAVGASLDKVGDSVSIEIRVCLTSPALAEALKVTLLGAKTYFRASGDLPPEAVDVIDKIVLSRSGSCTVIMLTATVGEIEELVEAVQEEEG